ncbi:hypothetical protein UT300012_24030 [Paraclostridium bifermentans]
MALKKQKRVRIGALVMALFIASPLTIFADTVSGIKYYNNINRDSDYKLDEKKVEEIKNKIPTKSDYTETFDEDAGRDSALGSKELSYLVENNILSREEIITGTPKGFEIQKGDIPVGGNITKSDFLMGMYKSIYGPIDSRPIVINGPSERDGKEVYLGSEKPKGYTGEGDSFRYQEGDYNVYVSPNVKELYMAELLNKSIIKDYEFVNADLARQITERSNDSKPRWDNSLPPYYPLTGETVEGLKPSGVLGVGYSVDGDNGIGTQPLGTFRATKLNSNIFVDENITTFEALEYIEEVLRLTEKDLTKTEIDLIAYKYGTSYILDLPKNTQDTVAYLIAMGVLDFENPGEFGNLYDNLSKDYAYKLMYRLKNKAGRKDFTKIQLNDTEDQLMKEGFVEQKLNRVKNFNGTVPRTLQVKEQGPDDYIDPSIDSPGQTTTEPNFEAGVTISKKDGFFDKILTGLGFKRESFRDTGDVRFADPDKSSKGFKGYTVTKLFLDTQNTRYKGVLLANLIKDNKWKDFSEIKEAPVEDSKGVTIKFEIKAPTPVQAVASVDSRITITDSATENDGNVNTITQVTKDGKKLSYISDKELKNKLSEVAVINSKTLKNKRTGDTAMLLADHDMALIGNKVIRSKADMVIRLNGVEYYNLDIIIPLMTNAYISQIDPSKLYTDVKLPDEQLATVKGSGIDIERTPVTKLNEINGGRSVYMYNSVLMSRGISTLIKDFEVKSGGKPVKATVVIDWNFTAPNKEIVDRANAPTDKLDVKSLTDYLHTRPESGKLQEWWDDNIELSNALANVMYDTTSKPQRYITSGYMAPSVYVLCPDKELTDADVIGEIFKKMKLPKSYVEKYLGGNINDFYNLLFNGDPRQDTLKGRRTFQVIRGEYKTENGYAVYGDRFAVMDTGAVYRSFESDPRLKLIKHSDKNYTIEVHTRGVEQTTETDEDGKGVTGQEVQLNGETFILHGFTGGKDKSGKEQEGIYYRLIPKKPIQGKPKKTEGGMTIAGSDGKDLVKSFYINRTRTLPTGTYRPWEDIDAKSQTARGRDIKKGNHYLVAGEVKLAHAKDGDGHPSLKNDSEYKGADVDAYYCLYLKRTEWKVINGKMVLQKTNPYLQQGNLFYSGLNSSLISRILDEDGVTVPYSKVPSGSKVLIADYSFVKHNGELHSEPIKKQGTANAMLEAATGGDSALESLALQQFSGISLDYSGRSAPLTSYIREAGLGSLINPDLASNTLYKDSSNVKIKKDKGTNAVNVGSGAVANSVCIFIKPDDNVYFRKIDDKTDTYVLSTNTNKFAEGYIDNVGIFYETLDLASMDDLYLVLEGNKFEPLDNAAEYAKDFLDKYKDALKWDMVTTLKFWLTVLISYFIIISWLVFGILEFGVGKNFLFGFREATNTTSSDTGGVDFIRIFTFSAFSIDDRLSASKLFLGNVMLFTLLYLVLDVIKF